MLLRNKGLIIARATVRSAAMPDSQSVSKRSVKRIIKFGGAAITVKPSYETLNTDVLTTCCKQVAALIDQEPPQQHACSWVNGTIVVHGAGSFGHFQASQYGVAKGGIADPNTKEGFVRTRLSVAQLNHHVVSALHAEGVPAVGLSPCNSWTTAGGREVSQHGSGMVSSCLAAGLLPVLHGDAVLDEVQGCSILSGDTIIRKLAEELHPEFVVFLTNVDGIFDRPPEEEGARLLELIEVKEDGSWSAAGLDGELKLTSASHDVTGGIEAKVQEAVNIVVLGVPVLLAKAGTEDAGMACLHGPKATTLQTSSGRNWRGTLVSRSSLLSTAL